MQQGRGARFSRAAALCAAISLAAAAATPRIALAADGAGAAQPSKAARDEASARFKKGVELFKEADYQAALVEFRRAYELVPNWQLLYNIGQVQFQLQDYAGALGSLERYLGEGGRQVPAARRAEVEKDIQTLKGRIAYVEVAVNVPDAEIEVDEVPVGKSPADKPITVSAGRRKITVSREGYASQTKSVQIASGDTAKLSFELQERGEGKSAADPGAPAGAGAGAADPVKPGPTTSAPPGGDAGGESSAAPLIGWTATAAFAGGAAVFGVLALGASGELKDVRSRQGVSATELQDASNKATTLAVVSDIFTGAAIIAGGISLYLTVSGGSQGSGGQARPSGPAVQVGIGPRGLHMRGSF